MISMLLPIVILASVTCSFSHERKIIRIVIIKVYHLETNGLILNQKSNLVAHVLIFSPYHLLGVMSKSKETPYLTKPENTFNVCLPQNKISNNIKRRLAYDSTIL